MKRYFVLIALAQIIGILQSAYLTKPAVFISAEILICLIIIRLCVARRLDKAIFGIALLFMIFGAFQYFTDHEATVSKYRELFGIKADYSGYIDSDVEYDSVNLTCDFYMHVTADPSADIKEGMIRIRIENIESSDEYEWGKPVKVRCRLEQAAVGRNPGEFDYSDYLTSNRVSATATLDESYIRENTDIEIGFFKRTAVNLRKIIAETITAHMTLKNAGVMTAMVTGDATGLDKDLENDFITTGLIHILTVSGMHMSFLIMMITFVMSKLKTGKLTKSAVIIAILFSFSMVAGMNTPVLRALVGCVIMIAANILRRENDFLTSIAISSSVILFMNPMTVLTLSYQLTFVSIICIAVFYKRMEFLLNKLHIHKIISRVLAVSISTQIGIWPLTAAYFQRIPLLSVLSNIMTAFAIEPAFIIGFLIGPAAAVNGFAASVLAFMGNQCLNYLIFITERIADMPFASISVKPPGILNTVIFVSTACFLIFGGKMKEKIKRPAAVFLIIALVFTVFADSSVLKPGIEVMFLDVGQGDSTVIRLKNGMNILVDCGGQSPEISEKRLLSYLSYRGIRRIDLLIITHGHSDHLNAFDGLIAKVKVKTVMIPDYSVNAELSRISSVCFEKGIDVLPGSSGESMDLSEACDIDVLLPVSYGENPNDESIVFILRYLDVKFLFAADMEKETEQIIAGKGIDADVLKVGHHGSNTSTTENFISAVTPEIAIISVGRNTFGHPSEYVIQRLREVGTAVFRTDLQGGVCVTSDGRSIKARSTIPGESADLIF